MHGTVLNPFEFRVLCSPPMSAPKDPLEKQYKKIRAAADSCLKDTRYWENQVKQLRIIKANIEKIEKHIAWAQMH